MQQKRSLASAGMWDRFRYELRYYMDLRGFSSQGLAEALTNDLSVDVLEEFGDLLSAEQVKRWRAVSPKARRNPPLLALPLISRALGMGREHVGQYHPTYLLEKMGMVDQQGLGRAVELAVRIDDLNFRATQFVDRAMAHSRSHSLNEIIDAARSARDYSVDIHPAVEGPPEARMYTADRLYFRRLDERDARPLDSDELYNHPVIGPVLRYSPVVTVRRNPWWEDSAAAFTKREQFVSWSLTYASMARPPLRDVPHPGLTSIQCYGMTIAAWSHDVASLLSLAVGYGLHTSRAVSMQLGETVSKQRQRAVEEKVHETYVIAPQERRVWSHVGREELTEHDVPVGVDPFGPVNPSVPKVWLRETDDLLEAYQRGEAGIPISDSTRSRIQRYRDVLDSVVSGRSDVIVKDVRAVPFRTGTKLLDRNLRWKQAMVIVLEVFLQLRDEGKLDSSLWRSWQRAAALDPAFAKPFLDWFAAQVHRP